MTPPAVTVADVMLRRPAVHPADITVGAARAAFETSPKLHLLLLIRDGALVGTLDRGDLIGIAGDAAPALAVASVTERTTPPDAPADRLRSHMIATGIRRLAVVDGDLRLLGLLCLKASRTGFCTDDGVEGMRRGRHTSDGHWS